MTNLTEQWKKGELPSGYYYIIVKKEFSNRIDFYNSSATIWSYNSNDVIRQVLAPVPSYEEWQVSYNCMLENEVLRLKNAQLKELLKECREILDYAKDFAYHDPCCKCIAKINQVLGE